MRDTLQANVPASIVLINFKAAAADDDNEDEDSKNENDEGEEERDEGYYRREGRALKRVEVIAKL